MKFYYEQTFYGSKNTFLYEGINKCLCQKHSIWFPINNNFWHVLISLPLYVHYVKNSSITFITL